MDPIHGLDWGTYYFFRDQRRGGTVNFEPVMLVGRELGSYLALGLAALLIFTFLCRRGWPRAPLLFAMMAILAVALEQGLKRLVHRPRPPDAELWLAGPSFGFPSSSALLSSFLLVAFAVTWIACIPRRGRRVLMGGIGTALVLFIGTSQLYLGLHFVTDLFAGWTAGVLLGLLFAGLQGASAKR
jgi:undecaprenyl-diphosphatase